MSQLGVGKEVLSYCNKCKLTLAHMIVTMKTDTTIGKTTCKTCNNTHAYKDPSAVKARKTKGGTTIKKKAASDSVSDIWMDKIATSEVKSQQYSPKTCFLQGDIIDHPNFGPGYIERLIDANKIEVIFRHDIKMLLHNK